MSERGYLLTRLNNPAISSLAAAVITLLLSNIFLRNGIILTVDGWAYWEGSVSLLNGDSFIYFGGQPITVFAPLFSVYLAGIQALIGIHGQGLVVGVTLLAALTSGAWVYLFAQLGKPEQRWPSHLLYILYASAFISYAYRRLLSETLFLLLLALTLMVFVHLCLRMQQGKSIILQFCVLNLLLLLLLFCRNSAIVFLPGIMLTLFWHLRRVYQRYALLLVLFLGFFTTAGWVCLRMILGQSNSHLFAWGGRFTPLQYGAQMIMGLASLLGPNTLELRWFALACVGAAMGLIIYPLLAYRQQSEQIEQRLLIDLFCIVLHGLVGLYLLFNVTYIYDSLNDRFLWFFALTTVGCLATWLRWISQYRVRRILLAMISFLVAMQLIRTGRAIMIGLSGTEQTQYVIAFHETIHPGYVNGPPIITDSYTILAPPAFGIIDRQYAEKTGK